MVHGDGVLCRAQLNDSSLLSFVTTRAQKLWPRLAKSPLQFWTGCGKGSGCFAGQIPSQFGKSRKSVRVRNGSTQRYEDSNTDKPITSTRNPSSG